VIIGELDEGQIRGSSTNYLTAWNSETGDVADTTPLLEVGQYVRAPDYRITRLFLFFDTTSIPSGATVSEAQLSLYFWSDKSTTDFNVTVQQGATNYPHKPLTTSDYDRTHYSGNGGVWDTVNYVSAKYYNITLNEDGRGWIQAANMTSFCLRSSRDIAGTSPSGFEYILLYAHETEGYTQSYPFAPPKLYVTYSYVYTEPEPPAGHTTPEELEDAEPFIPTPKITIPSWGYALIFGALGLVAVGSIVSSATSGRRGIRGVKAKPRTYRPRNLQPRGGSRLPKRSKRTGRFLKR